MTIVALFVPLVSEGVTDTFENFDFKSVHTRVMIPAKSSVAMSLPL